MLIFILTGENLSLSAQEMPGDTVRSLAEVPVVTHSRAREVIPVQQLEGMQLERLSAHSVADALRYFSGVQIKDYGGVGGLKTVNVRSMGSQHVGVFYDGVELGNAQNGQVDLGRYSLDNMEIVTLYNGQKSEVFQSAKDFASAASIYMQSRTPFFGEGERMHLKSTFKTGSFGLANPALLWEQKLGDRLSMSLNAEYMCVLGNAFYAAANPGGDRPVGGSCEPGVIRVAYDRNHNGKPDAEEWYEIAGSGHQNPQNEFWYAWAQQQGNRMQTDTSYVITYYRPASEPVAAEEKENYIRWEDSQGLMGYRTKNAFHQQPYFPQWIQADRLTFQGTCLPQNAVDEVGDGSYYVLYKFAYGYADNDTNTSDGSAIDIDWAVDVQGTPVHLPGVDFIMIYTGVNQENGRLGECSTEVAGVEDLHLLGVEIPSDQK